MKNCTKIPFDTQNEAEQELRRIVEGNDWRVWKQISNCRTYFCTKCCSYHLTSKVKIY